MTLIFAIIMSGTVPACAGQTILFHPPANCLVNADTMAGMSLSLSKSGIPSQCSIQTVSALKLMLQKNGGISNPRKGVMLKTFNMIEIGERAGSGIPKIFRIRREQSRSEPIITEILDSNRTVLSLTFGKIADKIGNKRNNYSVPYCS